MRGRGWKIIFIGFYRLRKWRDAGAGCALFNDNLDSGWYLISDMGAVHYQKGAVRDTRTVPQGGRGVSRGQAMNARVEACYNVEHPSQAPK